MQLVSVIMDLLRGMLLEPAFCRITWFSYNHSSLLIAKLSDSPNEAQQVTKLRSFVPAYQSPWLGRWRHTHVTRPWALNTSNGSIWVISQSATLGNEWHFLQVYNGSHKMENGFRINDIHSQNGLQTALSQDRLHHVNTLQIIWFLRKQQFESFFFLDGVCGGCSLTRFLQVASYPLAPKRECLVQETAWHSSADCL